MKKKIVLPLLLALGLSAVQVPRAHALVIGFATADVFSVVFGVLFLAFAGSPYNTPGEAAAYTFLGVFLDKDAKMQSLDSARLERDLNEQVRLGVLKAEEATQIATELETLDQSGKAFAVSIDAKGKTGPQIRDELVSKLGISELSADYLTVTGGLQLAD